MLPPKFTRKISTSLPHRPSTYLHINQRPKISQSLRLFTLNNFPNSMLKLLSSENTLQTIWSWSIGILMKAGVNPQSFPWLQSQFTPSIPHYIMQYNVLKVWRHIKTHKAKSDSSDQNATLSDLRDHLKEFLYQTLTAKNS